MCNCIDKLHKNKKYFQVELNNAICLLKLNIFNLKIHRMLNQENISNICIPSSILILIKKLIKSKIYCQPACDIFNYATYCDPCQMIIKKLKKTDILPVVLCCDKSSFNNSVKMLIAKYEGFINFFEKIIQTINDE
jgi:hypothetical protein